MYPLLLFATTELTLALPCGPLFYSQRLAIARLNAVVKCVGGTPEPLEACVLAMRDRPLSGALSAEQTKYLSIVMTSLREQLAAYTALLECAITAVLDAELDPNGGQVTHASPQPRPTLPTARCPLLSPPGTKPTLAQPHSHHRLPPRRSLSV